MAAYRQYINDQVVRTIRVEKLGTRTVTNSAWAEATGTMTIGATVETDDTASCLIGPSTAAGEFEIIASLTLSTGEVVSDAFTIEVWD